MPLLFALLASTLLHAAALVGPAWVLPGSEEPEALATTIEAVLARPPARVDAAPAKAAPKPLPARPRTPAPAAAADAPPVLVAPESLRAEAPAIPEPVVVAPAPVLEPAAPTPAKTALPGRGRVRYLITRGEGGFVIGQAIHTWDHDGFRYRLKSLTETTGLAAVFKPAQVLQSSDGEVTDDGLRPREFRHERVGSVDTASFDWLGRFVAYGGRRDAIVNGTQDMLSMYYQLVLLAPREGILEMPIATGRKLETYRFEVLGEETLALASGDRSALHVRTRSGSDTIELWLRTGEGAMARGLPLKIRFIDRKGEIFDQIADDAGESK
ncbi:MAG: DUF3108 domain-containing protein [Rhodocyclales bacterium]|nr:DUF3108 domain-containing protein [Rhodocyclales bacterium]